jgi:citrate lyase subunit beta/citryl-CoA lyase
MLHRSYLYVPGNRVDLIPKAAAVADAVIVDLEDAVPQAEKASAREATHAALRQARLDVPLYVRLNSGDMAFDDLAALHGCRIDGVRLAKAETPSLVADIDAALAEIERSAGDAAPSITIVPIVESAAGLFGMDAVAGASRRVRCFAFGATDFIEDLGGEKTASRTETLFARSYLVARSRLIGLDPPIAHVYTPIGDLDGLRAASREDRALGFFGRSCIHPWQVPVVNAVFAPSPEAIAQATDVIAAYERRAADGHGAFVMPDGTFIDEAHVRAARRLLSRTGRA